MLENGTWKRFHQIDEDEVELCKEYSLKAISEMGTGFRNISGQDFSNGNVTAVCLYPEKTRDNRVQWVAKCNLCGKHFVTTGKNLRNGNTKSCGCLVSKKCADRNRSHGIMDTPLGDKIYHIHADMIRRCYKPYRAEYPNYGGRGIYIVDEWYTPRVPGNPGAVNFYNWMIEQGYTLGCKRSVDRIDNDGPYAPWNCRLSNGYEQGNNKRNNRHIIDRDGEYLTFAQFERKHGLRKGYVFNALEEGGNMTLDLIVHNTQVEHKAYFDKESGEYKDEDGYIHLIDNINGDTKGEIKPNG